MAHREYGVYQFFGAAIPRQLALNKANEKFLCYSALTPPKQKRSGPTL